MLGEYWPQNCTLFKYRWYAAIQTVHWIPDYQKPNRTRSKFWSQCEISGDQAIQYLVSVLREEGGEIAWKRSRFSEVKIVGMAYDVWYITVNWTNHKVYTRALTASGKMTTKSVPLPKIVLHPCSDDDENTPVHAGQPSSEQNVSDAEKRRRESRCPLMMAIMKNKSEDISELSQTIRTSMNDLTFTGSSAIHEASFEGREECLRELIKCGADVNLADDEKWTPLHAAVLGGRTGCVALLIAAGANLFAESSENELPFHVAIKKRDDAMIAHLAAEMAKVHVGDVWVDASARPGSYHTRGSVCIQSRDGAFITGLCGHSCISSHLPGHCGWYATHRVFITVVNWISLWVRWTVPVVPCTIMVCPLTCRIVQGKLWNVLYPREGITT